MSSIQKYTARKSIHLTSPGAGASSKASGCADEKRGETVLVIEDDDNVRLVTVTALEWLGYSVLSADGARAALDLLENDSVRVDLALLDLVMPGMGGVEAFPLLRHARPDMEIVMTSGFTEDSLPDDVRDGGLSGFLVKPYSPPELDQALRAALAKAVQ